MTAPTPHEKTLLKRSEALLAESIAHFDSAQSRFEARMQVLEAAAAHVGGFDHRWFINEIQGHDLVELGHKQIASDLLTSLKTLPVSPSFALAALAKPEGHTVAKKREGTYYTDHRLAQHLVSALPSHGRIPTICDPACGAGSLLIAAVKQVSGADRRRRARLLAERLFAYDRDPAAARACAMSLASLTHDRSVIAHLRSHIVATDSLLDMTHGPLSNTAPRFDAVIANPPWDRLKATRHEALLALGNARHYGASYDAAALDAYLDDRRVIRDYKAALDATYQLQGPGERDLYKLFTELAIRLARPHGHLALVLPAGMIRSDSPAPLRAQLFADASKLNFTLLDNKASFFSIDSRFKFVLLTASFSPRTQTHPVYLTHASATPREIVPNGTTRLGRQSIAQINPNLTIPEVRNPAEWRLLRRLYNNGTPFGAPDTGWQPAFHRELDMTGDRHLFHAQPSRDTLPVIEGRMVHQYRHGAKRYVSGSGRAARWAPTPYDSRDQFRPQFWVSRDDLPSWVLERTRRPRVGFCDITGQTNERSMLASFIPEGVVCGNKVPTITFPHDTQSNHLLFLWLGIANSLAFDWIIRRQITTTINYFILRSLPMPPLPAGSLPARRISEIARSITRFSVAPEQSADDSIGLAWRRAEIEILVAAAYALTARDISVILDDFPIIDRKQPRLEGENRSSVTRDFVLARAHAKLPGGDHSRAQHHQARADAAVTIGALPFIPAEFARFPIRTTSHSDLRTR